MGFLAQRLGVEKSAKQDNSLGSGNHQINSNSIINGGAGGRFSPTNNPEWGNIQSVPTVDKSRPLTPSEAKALTAHRKQVAELRKSSRIGYQELQRIDNHEAKIHASWGKYVQNNAKTGLKQARINAGVGRTLHSLRPGYAKANASLERADNSAQNQINALAQQMNQL
ncbi:hypothetical protein [Okeania sp. SIO2B3]|uniref:hypothetical protein n=1 Tax=Okeania sp. SIO2B3 TaxID=2607784 RepID=UPI0013C246BB|nr:hypothetical protein [Okeania sp. SIO2B3]NET40603.1 hypothetical protein [Okeania sp. SIO2B3]